ncbi:Nucleoside-diphosphate-sugar epimerase [Pseudooceanicola antarcticus]|uniref:NAD(P)-dependent oxidoreductase n=1 Tax=Pseudooceanicola antarcticus TaxID=1247613 RepID=A0A285HLK6_9RHOB|nr:NAD(P)-dependent oxidoreductase [Pseudooceanicola antarcticus]PJE27973.1 NAD(P)-dependent oxidoreductase [Pseudooceanicola antarcticus]SNY35571.1 Nucleoside-diphosphate-sugar epimerase [Pseudooceanicola antarcticus]
MSGDRRHVVVTGAGGFVCAAFAQALASRGWQVTALDRHFDAAARRKLTGVRLVEADLLASPGVIASLAPGAVIHGAALTASPEALGISPAAHLEMNTTLTLRALAEARQAGAGRLIFLSSTGVFDQRDGLDRARLTEDMTPTAKGPYAATKLAGEILTMAAQEPDFAALPLRLGNIFGPGEVARPSRPGLSLPQRLHAEAVQGMLRSGRAGALREWAWLPDLAQGVAALLEALPDVEPGVLHAGTPPAIGDEALAELIAPGVPRHFATDGPMRPPMGSCRRSPMALLDWTAIPAGLAALGLSEDTP